MQEESAVSTKRPTFQKKELAYSSSPYLYLSEQHKVYAVEITHRDPVNGELLHVSDETEIRMVFHRDGGSLAQA